MFGTTSPGVLVNGSSVRHSSGCKSVHSGGHAEQTQVHSGQRDKRVAPPSGVNSCCETESRAVTETEPCDFSL